MNKWIYLSAVLVLRGKTMASAIRALFDYDVIGDNFDVFLNTGDSCMTVVQWKDGQPRSIVKETVVTIHGAMCNVPRRKVWAAWRAFVSRACGYFGTGEFTVRCVSVLDDKQLLEKSV